MVRWKCIKLDLLLKDIPKSMAWIMRRHLLMAKMTTVRTLIAVTSIFKWKIFQMDVKNASLNGDLYVEVCMIPQLGVSHKSGEV